MPSADEVFLVNLGIQPQQIFRELGTIAVSNSIRTPSLKQLDRLFLKASFCWEGYSSTFLPIRSLLNSSDSHSLRESLLRHDVQNEDGQHTITSPAYSGP